MADAKTVDRAGQCYCGDVKFHVKGSVMFNAYCHCKPCTRFRGVSPVHLIGVTPPDAMTITQGEELIKIVKDPKGGKLEHAFCGNCGAAVYQGPAGAPFRAMYPPTFQIEDGASCMMPAELQATLHTNYDNRARDVQDELPKYYPGRVLVDNHGVPIPKAE